MMTDYNDGKWHGWNGGECPVHPESEVETAWFDQDRYEVGISLYKARVGAWRNQIMKFRVIKAYREPREFWAVGQTLHDTKEEAEEFVVRCRASNPNITFGADYEPRKLIEVLE